MRLQALSLAAAAAACLVGCTTLSEREAEAREYRRIDFETRYFEYRERCHAGGGWILMEPVGRMHRDGIPRRGDRWRCIGVRIDADSL